jgi:hypothetical protein
MIGLDKATFDQSNDAQRKALCQRLSELLSERLRGASTFHAAVLAIVSELRASGHDLWSYDAGDDFEVWGPNYVRPLGPGIVITFRADNRCDVAWSSP